ncbi:MAG: hypothetical protein QOK04_2498 [Solirubrobacteraceae bacterium]|nr:hypothetical protein [Solirubrobacteraceae bacterium]
MSAQRSLLWPAFALVAVWAVAFSVGPTADVHINDMGVYRGYADAIRAGQYPYVDFALEYPPLALLVFTAAGALGTDPGTYEFLLGALMLSAALIVLVLTADLAGERGWTAAWLVALSPLLTGAMMRTHFDIVVVVLVLAALVALLADRPIAGFAMLGAGTMVKLFPGLLAPVAAAWLVGRGRGKEALRGLAVFGAVVVLVSLPFLSRGYFDSYSFQLERPVQIESTPASVLFAVGGSHVTGTPFTPDRYKSNGLAGGAAGPVAAVFTVLMIGTLAAVTALAARRRDRCGLLLAAFAALLAFAALGKVLSPQFMVWLVPFAALAWVSGERLLAGLGAGAILLTQLEFPARYADLVLSDTTAIVLVAVRNAVLLAALSVALVRLAGPARSHPHASAVPP